MALKVLLLRKKLTEKQNALAGLERSAEAFETREAELAADIEAAQTDEERQVVEEAVESFETERNQNQTEQETLRGEISALEEEIRQAEETARQARSGAAGREERKDEKSMEINQTRTAFFGMTVQQRDAFMARQDVKDFLAQVRSLRGQNRSVAGAELGIPTVMLDILRENMHRYSKLLHRVRFRSIKGNARQNIAGTVPEAVWTEAVGSLNELNLNFNQIEVDGFKVGGYCAIPNSTLEDDDDLELATSIMEMMGQAIGRGADKAIIYGDGVKKPIGIVTRLAAATQPSWWGTNQGTFTNLSATHVIKLSAATLTAQEFFQKLISALGVAQPKYSTSGEATWVMNHKTHIDLLSRCLAFNAAGALVAGMNNTMPIIGGEIVEIEDMPDCEIAGGFMDCYTGVERHGATVKSSDIPLMIQDQTVFVATQRLDGKPAVGEAFVVVNYNNVAVTTSATFAEDKANGEAAAASTDGE